MSDKPSYLGLLNGISNAETAAYEYLQCWIAVTPNPDVRCTLQTVAAREGEHGLAFAKRINELGYEVRSKDDGGRDKRMAIAGSDRPDVEKFEKLGLCDLEDKVLGIFDNVFADHSIDIRTGELLGRYIAEEYDSARLLRACYLALKEEPTGTAQPRLAALEDKVDALCAAVEDLQSVMRDRLPAGTANGRGRTKAAR